MEETKRLAQFVVNLRYEDLSMEVVHMTKNCILDLLACMMGGAEEKPAQIIRQVMETEPSAAYDATVLCKTPYKTSTLTASLSNGVSAHALDMDDVINSSQGHPGPPIIPAALAVAEKIGASGRELITAIVAGYEVYTRVAESVLPDSYYYWHVTSTAGTFGAAAAAGKLLKLSEQEMIYSLGSAGTQASGLFEFLRDGANSKTLHAGKACYNGVLSAQLSKAGFTAAEKILEGQKGFCRAMMAEPKLDAITNSLGDSFKIMQTSFKPYPCCRWIHSLITAALDLRKEHVIDFHEIASIHMRAHPTAVDITGNSNPKTVYGCKFSMQYCVAVALCFGQVGIKHFLPEMMYDSRIRGLMNYATVEAFPSARSGNEINYSELLVLMKDGTKYELHPMYAKGDPEAPMTQEEFEEKFRMLTEPFFSEKIISKTLQFVTSLDSCEDLSTGLSFLTT